MPQIDLGDQRIFYARHDGGGGSRLNCVLIHGAGGTHLDWPPQLRRLNQATVYALDLPGHGRSVPPGRSSVVAYADDVLAFIGTLDLQDVVLVGHSMGGAIAQSIGLNPPPSVVALVLIGTGARLRVSPAIMSSVLEDYESTAKFICDCSWASGAPADLVAGSQQSLLKNEPAIVHDDYRACDSFDIMDEVGSIRLPTLVISGTKDQMTPLKYGRFLADNIANARLVAIEDGGHMMALEQPEPVAKAIDQFLTDLIAIP